MSLYRIGAAAADADGLVRIPFMLPTLCAGFPSPAEDFIEGAQELPRWLVPNPPATFIWRVRGWCMKGAGIQAKHTLTAMALDDLPRNGDRHTLTVLVTDEDGRPVYTATPAHTGLVLAR